jgi:hypothetical protein
VTRSETIRRGANARSAARQPLAPWSSSPACTSLSTGARFTKAAVHRLCQACAEAVAFNSERFYLQTDVEVPDEKQRNRGERSLAGANGVDDISRSAVDATQRNGRIPTDDRNRAQTGKLLRSA